MLLTTTAQPTALADAGTSYSHIAVRIGNNFIELEINNAVEITLPLSIRFVDRGITCYTREATLHPIGLRNVELQFPLNKEQGKTNTAVSTDFLLIAILWDLIREG